MDDKLTRDELIELVRKIKDCNIKEINGQNSQIDWINILKKMFPIHVCRITFFGREIIRPLLVNLHLKKLWIKLYLINHSFYRLDLMSKRDLTRIDYFQFNELR